MTSEIFTISSGTFGLIVGGVSLLTLIISVVRFHLPSNKIKVLESLLDDTEACFKKAVEDGLLIEVDFVQATEKHLVILRNRTCTLQSRAYSVTTLRQDYTEFLRGTSTSIGTTCQSLKKLRAEVIACSEERRKLMEMNSAPQSRLVQFVPPPGLNPINPKPLKHILPPIAETIRRPRSCPVTLSESRLVDTIADNPFSDHTQIDSDVDTADVQSCPSSVHTSVKLELEA